MLLLPHLLQMDAQEFLMGVVTISCSVLFAFRCICVWQGTARAVVGGFLSVITLGLVVAWMLGVPDISAAWIPGGGAAWTDGGCTFTRVPMRYAVKFIVTLVFDILVTILTVAGVMRMTGGSRIGKVLVEQGFIYLMITLIFNVLLVGLTLARLNPVMSTIMAIPALTVSLIAATRLYVDLAESARPRNVAIGSADQIDGTGGMSAKLGFPSALLFGRRKPERNSTYGLPQEGPGRLFYGAGVGAHSTASSPTDDKFGTRLTTGSSAAGSSREDLEKGSAAGSTRQSPPMPSPSPLHNIHTHENRGHARTNTQQTCPVTVSQTETITTEPIPAHLAGPPFLSEEQAFALAHPNQSVPDPVARAFPRLGTHSRNSGSMG